MTILFFGDIVGKISRQAIKKIIPELKKELQPDLIMANVENLAHGKGVTENTLQEMLDAGISAFTSGNHITKKGDFKEILENKKYPLVRPANYPPSVPGREYIKVKAGKKDVYIINFSGRVSIREDFDCPFRKFDELKKLLKLKKNDIVIVDFHAETTSEKVAFGFYVDGQVSAVLGTHTHIPTADEKILSKGTGYITDVGMVGPVDSVLGIKKEGVIETYLTQVGSKHELIEQGEVVVNAIVLDIDDKSGKCKDIKRIKRIININ